MVGSRYRVSLIWFEFEEFDTGCALHEGGRGLTEWRDGSLTPDVEAARYRSAMARLLAEATKATDESERRLAISVDDIGSSFRLGDDPTGAYRVMCALLLRKARIHTDAALQANQAGNIHSLGVQMRPVLECAGQVVFTYYNLMVAPGVVPGHTPDATTEFLDRDYRDSTIRLTKGAISYEQLLQNVDEAAAAAATAYGMPTPKPHRGSRVRHVEKVSRLPGGPAWYGFLSGYFCHGDKVWPYPSWRGGVDWIFACFMDYLSQQVVLMNAYAYLCPVKGSVAFDQGMAELARRQEMHETSEALRSAIVLTIQNEQGGSREEAAHG